MPNNFSTQSMKKLLSILLTLLIISPLLLSPVYSQSDKSQGKKKDKDNPVTNPVQSNYTYEVSSLGLLDTVKTSSLLNLPITIKNASSVTWDRTEVTLAYHWVDSNGQYEVYRGDETSLKKSIDPNKSSTNQTIQVRAPELPGNYTFVLDPIYKDQWFSSLSSSTYKKVITVTGSISENESKEILWINGGDEYTNNPNVQANLAALSFQPGSTDAAFVYEYAQLGTSISNWGIWRAISGTGGSSLSFNLGITGPYSGPLDVFGRFRAFKKFSSATPLSYGDAQYHYGRSEKTTDAYSDDIFFDNIPPQGSIVINDGASSTSSRNVSLKITATDNLLGMTGSGIDKMRLSANCAGWGDWKSLETSISSFNISSGSTMSACVQFKDNAGNISETYSDSITFYIPPSSGGGGVLGVGDYSGLGIGNHDNPYADKTIHDFNTPEVGWRRYIGLWGLKKWNDMRYLNIDAPLITYIERVDEDTVKVFGISINKKHDIDVLVRNEYRDYPLGPSHWEDFEETRDIDHVKVVLFNGLGIPIATLWNDASDGRWEKDLDLGLFQNEGDKIYARTYVYDKFYFDGLHWWEDSKEYDVQFSIWGERSDKSPAMEIPSTRSQKLLDAIETEYLIELKENGASWTEFDLENIQNALERIPSSFYDNGLLDITKENYSSDETRCDGVGTMGYVMSDRPHDIYVCELGQAISSSDLNFQATIIHEFAHNWQKSISSTDIKYGMNVVENSSHPLHQYYNKLSNPSAGRWYADQLLFEKVEWYESCNYYDNDIYTEEVFSIFVSYYACLNTMLKDPEMPEEEMAESISYYFIKPNELIKQDKYTFKEEIDGEIVTNSGDLKRYDFIRDNVK